MQNALPAFLNEELKKRGWSQNELARRSGLSHTSIIQVMTGKRGAGIKFIQGVSHALNVPVEQLLRVAGIIEPPPNDEVVWALTAVARRLNEGNQQKLLEYAQLLLQSQG